MQGESCTQADFMEAILVQGTQYRFQNLWMESPTTLVYYWNGIGLLQKMICTDLPQFWNWLKQRKSAYVVTVVVRFDSFMWDGTF